MKIRNALGILTVAAGVGAGSFMSSEPGGSRAFLATMNQRVFPSLPERAKSQVRSVASHAREASQSSKTTVNQFGEFRQAIEFITADDLLGDLKTIAAARDAVQAAYDKGSVLLESHATFQTHVELYRVQLEKASPTLRQLASQMLKYETEAPYDSLQRGYQVQAEIYQATASRFETRLSTLQPALSPIADAMTYTKECVVFLKRTLDALDVANELAASGTEVELLIENLKTFATGFDELQENMEFWSERLKEFEREDAAFEHFPLEEEIDT
ncbi:MAG: hypothetical protein KDA60_00810 [Planctomycetales bacterium]|nr:hypothetical protein [Planctomycetales bacterium]